MNASSSAVCPWCSAPRASGPACSRCGADYAKAEAIKSQGRVTSVAASPEIRVESVEPRDTVDLESSSNEWRYVDDPLLEWKFCVAAIPMALCCAIAFNASGIGSALQRIFLTMPVHEFGHAVTAWFCGYTAIPTLWKTIIPETRGFIAPLALAGAAVYLMFYAYRASRIPMLGIGAVLLLMQVIGTLIIKPDTAQMLITFGGDGMGLILATLLMGSFYFGKGTQLYKGSLRWGFIVIGAAAFIDIYATWWRSRKDESAIPYGTTGGMATDAMKLVDDYGWSLQILVSRYVALGVCCLIALALVYAWGLWRAKTELDARQRVQKKAAWDQRMQGRS